jgi:hypothetical protein
MLLEQKLHPTIMVSFANSIEFPLLVLYQLFLHMHDLVLLVIAEHNDLSIGVDLDALLRREMH